MTRTTAPCHGGRIVTYTSDDGLYRVLTAPSLPSIGCWNVVQNRAGIPDHVGTFRSEREAMDQARSRVKYYELEMRPDH